MTNITVMTIIISTRETPVWDLNLEMGVLIRGQLKESPEGERVIINAEISGNRILPR